MFVPIFVGAEAAQYLSSGHALKHPCALILDFLSRKVQKKGTVHPRLCGNAYSNGFRKKYYGQSEAGVGGLSARTLRDRDVEDERTGMFYSVSWYSIPPRQRPSTSRLPPFSLILINLAALHNKADVLHQFYVFQRITINRNDVSQFTRGDLATVGDTQ